MNTIYYILENFHICTNLPIRSIDNKFNVIKSFGYNDDLDSLYNNSNIILNVDSNSDRLYKIKYLNFEDIYYFIEPISKLNIDKGFYIIGPFTTSKHTNTSLKHISFRTLDCITYIRNLLRNIHEDTFSKGRISKGYNIYVKKAVEYCIENYNSEVSIDCICNSLNINKCYFCKLFKAETGYTFSTFLNILRVEKSKELLKSIDMSLLDVATAVGFNSQNYYTMVFKKITNQTPIQYRNNLI